MDRKEVLSNSYHIVQNLYDNIHEVIGTLNKGEDSINDIIYYSKECYPIEVIRNLSTASDMLDEVMDNLEEIEEILDMTINPLISNRIECEANPEENDPTKTERWKQISDKVVPMLYKTLFIDEDMFFINVGFVDMGADSLDLVNIQVEISHLFNLNIPDDDAKLITTPVELIMYIYNSEWEPKEEQQCD